mmetsp:Transcript_20573/g.28352  ORF Transcript_20573/g.28352 Transcript_20573/m.28352 type:complete len:692 (+) Transcript_20573:53-2128(+)
MLTEQAIPEDDWLSELKFDICPYLLSDGENPFEFDNVSIKSEKLNTQCEFDTSKKVQTLDECYDFSDDSCTDEPATSNRKVKKRKFNPDTLLIAAATEDTLKSLKLDPNSKEGKKKKRQIRNRMSAQFHRDRKNEYIKKLENIISEKTVEISKCYEIIKSLREENSSLKASTLKVPYVMRIPLENTNCGSTCLPNFSQNYGTDHDNDSDLSSLRSNPRTPLLLPSSSPTSQMYSSNSDEDSSITLPPLPSLLSHTNSSINTVNFLPSSRGMGILSRTLTIVSVVCMVAVCLIHGPNGIEYSNASTAHMSRRLFASEEYDNNGNVIDSVHHLNDNKEKPVSEYPLPQQPSTHFQDFIFNNSHQLIESTKQPKVTPSRRYLRSFNNSVASTTPTFLNHSDHSHSDGNNNPLTSQLHPGMFLMRSSNKMLTQYDPLHFGWPLNSLDYSVLSYSSVVMKEGSVLLDPALALSHNTPHAYSFSSSRSASPREVNSAAASISLYRTPAVESPPLAMVSLPLAITDGSDSNSHSNNNKKVSDGVAAFVGESLHSNNDRISQELIAVNSQKLLLPMRGDELGESHVEKDPSNQHSNPHTATQQQQKQQQQQFINQLFSELNLVTIRLPASSVKVGKSWGDSEYGTVESIMNVLNLHDDNNNNSSSGTNRSTYAVAHTSLEINCIIMGAKIIHHATSTAV